MHYINVRFDLIICYDDCSFGNEKKIEAEAETFLQYEDIYIYLAIDEVYSTFFDRDDAIV